MKRYTLYVFPSFHGSPRHFRFKWQARIAAALSVGMLCELQDNKTGKYYPYWA